MAIITLTTDFGLKDHYVAAVKGAIYTEIPETTIVDISHQITPFNYTEAAYILKNAYHHFPEGSIHIIGLDAELSTQNNHLVMYCNGHYFICANNGILSILATIIAPEKVIEITTNQEENDNFPVKNVFTKIACHLARGGSMDLVGRPFNKLKEVTNMTPVVNPDNSLIVGHVQYIDNYGNIITTISKDLITRIAKGRAIRITIRNFTFDTIYNTYGEAANKKKPSNDLLQNGKRIALYNSNNQLEIILYKGSLQTSGGASSLLGISHRDSVSVAFLDH